MKRSLARFFQEDNPSPGPQSMEQPGAGDRLICGILKWDDLVDPEARAMKLALQLAPAVEMHFHAMDAAVGHPAVSDVRLARDRLADLAYEPPAALRIAKIEEK